jgi:hypothetical protein
VAGSIFTGYITKLYRNAGNDNFADSGATIIGVNYGSQDWADYDDDGDLDLLLAGHNTGTKIYRNDGAQGFADAAAGLAGAVGVGAAEWGDYDNDGDLDILIAGCISPCLYLYRNDGGVFAAVTTTLPSVRLGVATWGDYDNDGDLDIALLGSTQSQSGQGYIGKIYQNIGDNRFVDTFANLPPTSEATAVWVDYNNDGWLDLAVTGCVDQNCLNRIATIFHNHSGASFTNLNPGMTGVIRGQKMAWGDYDNDSDLDDLYVGCHEYSNCPGLTALYRNNLDTPNSLPGAPGGLTATPNGDLSVDLAWSPGSDAETPPVGLTYNLRVGTTPGGNDVMPSMALPDGLRLLPDSGNNARAQTKHIGNLWANATYFWSVQTIDSVWAGSPFAPEATFSTGAPTVQFADDLYYTNEYAEAVVQVTLSAPSAMTVTVDYAASDGSALAPDDFTATSGTLTFAPGQTSRTFAVPVENDGLGEPDETVLLHLSNPSHAALAEPNQATLVIGGESAAVFFSPAAYTASEDENVLVRVVVTRPLTETASIDYATLPGTALPGVDYEDSADTLVIPAWALEAGFSVPLIADDEIDPGKAFSVSLTNPISVTLALPDTANITIRDDDLTVQFETAAYSVDESGASAVLTATLNAPAAVPVTVGYWTSSGTAAAGSDYGYTAASLEFEPGETAATLSLPILEDDLDEADETVVVSLANPQPATLGAPTAATVTIFDNDTPPAVEFSQEVYFGYEFRSSATVTATLSAASGQIVTAQYAAENGTATAGQDFALLGDTVIFSPGETTRTFTVIVLNDVHPEGSETAGLELSAPVNAGLGARVQASLVIIDNDEGEPYNIYWPLMVSE